MANCEANPPGEDVTISTAVAIDKDKNSQHAVRWAAENLMTRGDKQIVLIHVNTQQILRPQECDPSRPSIQSELQQLFLPFRGFCARKGIRAKEVTLYDLDIASVLADYVATYSIKTIVLGASNRSAIARAFKNPDIPSSVAKSVPPYCSVYAVSKGKTQKIKSANESDSSINPSFLRQGSRRSSVASELSISSDAPSQLTSDGSCKGVSPVNIRNYPHTNVHSTTNSSTSSLDSQYLFPTPGRESTSLSFEYTSLSSSYNSPDNSRAGDAGGFDHANPLRRIPGNKKYLALQQSSNFLNLRGRTLEGLIPHDFSRSSDHSEGQSFNSDISYEPVEQHSDSNSCRSSVSSQTSELEEELRRMKQELQNIIEMYNIACQEAVIAREQVRNMVQWKSEEESKLAESKHAQEAALAIMETEKQKCKTAVEVAQVAERIAELEAQKRKRAEMKYNLESEQKQMAMDVLARIVVPYRKYTIEEIEAATNHFSSSQEIGEGGYGPVYKALLDHTPVAIKVLKNDIAEGQKQFIRELEVLSQMRHPHMVILLGACPEYGCLIYEYMENGSLEDRIFCRNNTPPLPWSTRFKIAAEIAMALNFLHQTKPEPLVHRDLKPANILLDKYYVSKISDVGLSRLVPPSVANTVTQYRMTTAAGTFCYIDPEYQQTGMLGTKSDIYSLGILLLQIIAAQPAMGLRHQVQSAIETGRFAEVLDPKVEDWPVDEALCLAKLALKCCELRRKDRPDLDSVILPELVRLRDLADSQSNQESRFVSYSYQSS